MQDIHAIIEHGLRYVHHPANRAEVTLRQQQLYELQADRYANAILLIGAFLTLTRLHPADYPYAADASQLGHPNMRDRIILLLQEAYGNDIFKMSGEFSEKGDIKNELEENAAHFSFNVQMQDGFYVTEDGKKVTNWKEINHEIDLHVAQDIQRLDQLVRSGFSEKEQDDFVVGLSKGVLVFRAKYAPKLMSLHNVHQLERFMSNRDLECLNQSFVLERALTTVSAVIDAVAELPPLQLGAIFVKLS